MPQVFYKDGKPVPDAKVAEAIASGEGYAKGRVAVRDENGTVGTIDASELGKPGYQPLTDGEIEQARIHEQRGTLGQQAITGLEGAARGATLGLSDVATTGLLGDDYRKAALERAGENKKIAIGSEVVGAIAPTLLSGGEAAGVEATSLAARAGEGASLLSKAARLAPSSLVSSGGRAIERGVAGIIGEAAPSALGRMAQRAAAIGASGAVEGGLYGAGNAVSEAALEGTPITAEKVLGGFGHGALFGGALGAGLGGLGGLGSSAFERIVGGSSGLREGAEKLANESALKAVGFQGSDFRRLAKIRGEDAVADVGSELLDYTFKGGPLEGKKLFTAAKKAEDFVDDLKFAKSETGSSLGEIRKAASDAGVANPAEAPDLGRYLSRVDSEVLEPLRSSPLPSIRRQGERVEEELSGLKERFERQQSALTAEPIRVRLPDGSIEMRPITPPPSYSLEELEKIREKMRTIFQPPSTNGLPAAVPEHAAHLQKAERILADEIDKSVERHLAASGIDPTEYEKLKRTYGALSDLEKVADKAAAQQLGNRRISPSDYGVGIAGALGAIMSGNVGGLFMGAGSAIAHKVIRERGNSVLAVMADSVAKMDGRIQQAAQSLAGLAAAPKRAALVSFSAPDFDRTAAAVRAFASNPQAASQALARPVEGIADQHPELAAQMQQTLAGDYQYLATKIPPSLGRANSSLTPQLEKARIPKSEQAKFMSVVHALEDPGSVIEKVAAGELPREQIEALKVRRPEIYNQMRTETIKAFSMAKAPRGILERTRVSLAFDFNGDSSLDPQTLAAIQASNRGQPIPDEQPAKDGQQRQQQSTKMNPKEAETLATPSQKAIGS